MAIKLDKLKRIQEAEPGDRVAFYLPNGNGKAISAEIYENYSDDGMFYVVTKNGAEFEVDYADVLWVKRFDGRWPRWVYNALKGIGIGDGGDDGEQQQRWQDEP